MTEVGNSTLELVVGDIVEQDVDTIVNAANASLAGGGGVDGAIHRGGGPTIMDETRRRYPAGCPTGSAVLTGAGALPARWIVHAVGPRYRDGQHDEEELLRSAHRISLEQAITAGARSIAFPAISTGAYGYPVTEAASAAIDEVCRFLEGHDGEPLTVRFVLFDQRLHAAYSSALRDRT